MQPSEHFLVGAQVQPRKVEEGNGVAVTNVEEKCVDPW